MAEKTLAMWRYKGEGPQWIKLNGGFIRYHREVVDAWLAEQVKTSTARGRR